MKTLNKRKILSAFILSLFFVLSMLIAIPQIISVQANLDSNASVNEVFTFTQISDTECKVSLKDKVNTVIAIVPSSHNGLTVTEIANNGFMSSAKLELVLLPRTVKKIGTGAFTNCKKLSRISMSGVEEIGQNAFAMCTAMEGIILPSTVTQIGNSFMRACSDKATVYARFSESSTGTWGSWLASFSGNVVYDCYDIMYTPVEENGIVTAYTIDSFQSISDNTMDLRIDFHEGLPITNIGWGAFWGCEFNSVTVGAYSNHAINIEGSAFAECAVVGVGFDNNVTFFDENSNNLVSESVFVSSLVEEVMLPSNMTNIPANFFESCENLNSISYAGSVGENYLPFSITKIGTMAFNNCTSLDYLYIPETVSTVDDNVFVGWTNKQTIEINKYYLTLGIGENQWHPYWNGGDAIIELQQYNVVFNSNRADASYSTVDKKVDHDTAFSNIDVDMPTCESHNFTGKWYTDAACTKEFEATSKVTSDLQLYAGWEIKKYTLILPINDYYTFDVVQTQGVSGGENGNYNIDFGTDVVVIVLINAAYTQSIPNFVVNGIDYSGTRLIIPNVKSDLELEVVAPVINTYLATYKTKGTIELENSPLAYDGIDSEGFNSYSLIYEHGESLYKPTSYLRGHKSIGWKIGFNIIDFDTFIISDNIIIQEELQANKYEIVIDYSAYTNTIIREVSFGSNISIFGTPDIPSTSALKFRGWYFDNAFTKPVPENFDAVGDVNIDNMPNSNGISAKYNIYAKLTYEFGSSSWYKTSLNDNIKRICLDSTGQLRLGIPSTRIADLEIILDNYMFDSRSISNGQIPIEINASDINVNIIVKGENKLYGYNGKDARVLQYSDPNAYDGENGNHAIYSKCNITFTAVDDAKLYLYGGQGGHGYNGSNTNKSGNGGNGVAALKAEKNVTFSSFNGSTIYLSGSAGGDVGNISNNYRAGNGGEGIYVGGTITFDKINNTTVTIKGGEGGMGGNVDAYENGKGGRGGHAIYAGSDVTFSNSQYLILRLNGGNGGQSTLNAREITNPGGNGIKSNAKIYFSFLTNLDAVIEGAKHGYFEYYVNSISGSAGVSGIEIYYQTLANSIINIIGGAGRDAYNVEKCGKGGNAVETNYSYVIGGTANTITYTGGKGGSWIHPDNPSAGFTDGGSGYKFTATDKSKAASSIIFIDGETPNTGDPNDWGWIS